jgi:hypothetical protein
MRETKTIHGPNGMIITTYTPETAVTLGYPSEIVCRASLIQSASLVLSSATWAETILIKLPDTPFDTDDFHALLGRKDINALNIYHGTPKKFTSSTAPGRNDTCPPFFGPGMEPI